MKKILLITILLLPFFARAEKFCLIADIHNGNGTRKLTKENITYPKYAKRYFKSALKYTKKEKVDACIILGDNANNGKSNQAKELAKIAKKGGVKILWVKGNHDSAKSQKHLYTQTNYFMDFSNIRIVVLDSDFVNLAGNGGVSLENQEFYKQVIQTDRKVILAMHHPPFDKKTHQWNPAYDWIGDKPEYVLSGHFHTGFREGKYWSVPALTLKKQLRIEYIEL